MQRRRFLSAAFAAGAAQLPARRGEARGTPGFPGIQAWLNTAAPADPPALGDRATLVNFWTYSCINVRRTLPYLRRWDATYGPAGLRIIGIHTPEFEFEHLRDNVAAAVQELGLRYPVGLDNDTATWRGWSNRAWPAFHLLDRAGKVVLSHEGEGHAGAIEGAIRGLLGASLRDWRGDPGDDADLSRVGTPEIYFGANHPTPQEPAQSPRRGDASYAFSQAPNPRLNRYALDGLWSREAEALTLRSPHGALRLRFSAARLHVVAAAPAATPVRVSIDGGAPRVIALDRTTLYTLFESNTYGEHWLELEARAPNLALFSATFG